MQTEQETKRELEKKESPSKRVRFSEDTKDTFTPLLRPDPSAIRNMWIKFFNAGDYERLTVKIFMWQQKGLSLEQFFKLEGQPVVAWAVNYPYAGPLCFIFENVPKALIKSTIIQDELKLLKWFLLIEGELETDMPLTAQERLDHRLEKVKLFLSLGSDMKDAMIEIVEQVSREEMRDKLKLFLEKAIEAVVLDEKKYNLSSKEKNKIA